MVRVSSGATGPARNWTRIGLAAALALGLNGCDSYGPTPTPAPTPPPTPTPSTAAPTGCLSQPGGSGAISCVTDAGWRIEIAGGAVTIQPPGSGTTFRYASNGTTESLGSQQLRTWGGNRRTLVLPGGGKITMHAQGTALARVSIYDGDESHEIDPAAQAIRHSQVDAGVAASRDEAELDGEAGHLGTLLVNNPAIDFLYLANIYAQTGTDGTVQPKVDGIQPLGRQLTSSVILYDLLTHTFPTESPTACGATPVGGLTKNGDGTLTYVSRSGEYRVEIDEHQIVIFRGNPSVQKWEVWGDPHENLNGKHIKDWEITRRTLVLSDGIKITMDAAGAQGIVQTTSIYDGPRSHQITNDTNAVAHSCVDAAVAAQRDAAELDGEAGYVAILRTGTSPIGAMIALNYYNETAGPGGAFVRGYIFQMLGITGEPENNPNNVNDYYDDPRLGHT